MAIIFREGREERTRWSTEGEGVRDEYREPSDTRRLDLDDNEGARGREDNRLRLFDIWCLKLLGGGLGASPV